MNDSPLPGDATFDALPVRNYLRGATIALEDGYYCPCSSEPTLDSSVYVSATKTAWVLQASVLGRHGVVTKGFEWRKRLGVETFRYICVSCPDEQIDLPFPNQLSGINISNKYALVLHSIPFDTL
jgi:hypothetical protein